MKIQDIKVNEVDTDKLIKWLEIETEQNEEITISSFALYKEAFEINTDCCFGYLQNTRIKNKIVKTVAIECGSKIITVNEDGSNSVKFNGSVFMELIAVKDLKPFFKEVSLVDFIRFNYNPRIIGNQKLLMKHIKGL